MAEFGCIDSWDHEGEIRHVFDIDKFFEPSFPCLEGLIIFFINEYIKASVAFWEQ